MRSDRLLYGEPLRASPAPAGSLLCSCDEQGTVSWRRRRDGVLHRPDGPALVYANDDRVWYLDGLRHRERGPAQIYATGGRRWWRHGLLHNESGPAVIAGDGTSVEYWLEGVRLSAAEWARRCAN
jgi:hypothetical protein